MFCCELDLIWAVLWIFALCPLYLHVIMNRSCCRRDDRQPGLPGDLGVQRADLRFTPIYVWIPNRHCLLVTLLLYFLVIWDEPAWLISLSFSLPNLLVGYGIIVRGRFSSGVVLASQYPVSQGRPHNSEVTSCGRTHPRPGGTGWCRSP